MGIFAEDATPGMMAFYRKEGEAPFDGEDMALLEMLREHFELRLQQNAREVHGNSDGKLTIRGAVERYDLTKREETILRLLMQGVERDKICEQLVISVNTLKKHMGNIYRKLGIKNRVQMFKMIREKE
jgi:DNA-binding CsgD family transcriptional regulator